MLTPFVTDRAAALDAARLLADHGAGAIGAAAAKANLSRDRGNLVHFCRWRQVAALIAVLDEVEVAQTRH